jgi:hypothetical protein
MSDNPLEPPLPAKAGTPNTVIDIGGDVVRRDKIVQTIINEVPAPIATSLHQLPARLRDFTGCETELCELRLSVLDDQRALLLMNDTAGGAQVEPSIPTLCPSCWASRT